jgi:hypothetical protein
MSQHHRWYCDRFHNTKYGRCRVSISGTMPHRVESMGLALVCFAMLILSAGLFALAAVGVWYLLR